MDSLAGLSRRNDAAYRADRTAYAARIQRDERLRVLKGLMDDGYPDSLTLNALYQDVCNDAAPLPDRIGRGFTA